MSFFVSLSHILSSGWFLHLFLSIYNPQPCLSAPSIPLSYHTRSVRYYSPSPWGLFFFSPVPVAMKKIHTQKQFKEGKIWGKQKQEPARAGRRVSKPEVVMHACPVDACNCFLLLQFLPLCVCDPKLMSSVAGIKARVWGDTFCNVRKEIAHCRQLLDALLKNSSTLKVPCFVILKSFLKVPGISRFSWRRFAAALLGSSRRWHTSCLPRLQSSAALTCCGFCLINRCWYDSTSL